MFAAIVPQVLEKYGVSHVRIHEVQKGYRNESYAVQTADDTLLNVIFFKNEPEILARIKRADYASAQLTSLPARQRYDKRLLQVRPGTYAGLYTYLPGKTVPWESYTKKHIKLTGFAMSTMHRQWQSIAPIDSHSIDNDLLPLIDRMERYFSGNAVKTAMHQKLHMAVDPAMFGLYKELIRHGVQLPGQQIIHMDMVRGNVLFDKATDRDKWTIDDTALTGVIDFEKSTIGHPVFDIARTIAFLLVDSPKPSAKIYHYFLDSGYKKRGNMPLPDAKLLHSLVTFFLMHDFYKFLRHTPYESLHDNYHYKRTCDILKDYGMISPKR